MPYADELDQINTETVGQNNKQTSSIKGAEYLLQRADGTTIDFYSMLEMSINNSSNIPNEPIEKGSFASYNRVIEPIEATAKLAIVGTDSEIQNVLNVLDELQKGEEKISFITPFDTYDNLMLEVYDYRRDGSSGQNVLQVEIRLKEVREVETGKTTKAVDEPPPIEESATMDGSCASGVDYGERQTYTPSGQEVEASEGTGRRSSTLYDIFRR